MFLKYPLLCEIFWYLEAEDLMVQSQVNRLFNKAANRPELWRALFFKECYSPLAFFRSPPMLSGMSVAKLDVQTRSWKDLVIMNTVLVSEWPKLSSSCLSSIDKRILGEFVRSNLKNPVPLPPPLRREQDESYTLLQDMFAFPDQQNGQLSSNTRCSAILENLNDVSGEIQSYMQALIQMRGNLSSIQSNGNLPFLMNFMLLLNHAITTHCESTMILLANLEDPYEFIHEYTIYFDAYVASIQNFELEFSAIKDMLNRAHSHLEDIGQSLFSFRHFLSASWRQLVLEPLWEKFCDSIMILATYSDSFEAQDLLQRSVYAVADLSVDEVSVHYIKHSGFPAGKHYNDLSARLINHFSSLPKSAESIAELKEIVDHNLMLAERCLLPCTAIPVQQILLNDLKTAIEVSYAKGYRNNFDMHSYEQTNSDPSMQMPAEVSGKMPEKFYLSLTQEHQQILIALEELNSEKMFEDKRIEHRNKNLAPVFYYNGSYVPSN